jgi:hypothetical protein
MTPKKKLNNKYNILREVSSRVRPDFVKEADYIISRAQDRDSRVVEFFPVYPG